ncbi:hypothetical protein CFII64_06565 [Pseudomonas sp. CFII64]|nr:hypothetical protein CFII64_06565 [Pseudomonas sp. CFII64]
MAIHLARESGASAGQAHRVIVLREQASLQRFDQTSSDQICK